MQEQNENCCEVSIREAELKRLNIAYINLNKTGGGITTSKEKMDFDMNQDDRKYVQEEIRMINPKYIVIFGNNAKDVWDSEDLCLKEYKSFRVPHFSSRVSAETFRIRFIEQI